MSNPSVSMKSFEEETTSQQQRRDYILSSDHATDESLIESKIPAKSIYAFGADKILHSARISLLDSERLSNLRYLIITNEALYIFDDQDFERRIPNEQIIEIVKYQDPAGSPNVTKSPSNEQNKSHRLLFRVKDDSDLLIICKGATGVLETLQKQAKDCNAYRFSQVDPAEDLFSKATFIENQTTKCSSSLKQSLENALNASELKKVMLYLEYLRRQCSQNEWESDSLILRAIEYVKSQ
ncbi:hypothetical protein C9374_009829 [Naegleria lovaniensis]|uniref:Uncharacterized protein n=1 Tax=Naegleria lovaniensis TaxID=51637 RepID=A0AA88H5S2_NAELO|nr:uncharacterized protein C9374_009829 [Naegleria lovaniensis]KAG2393252.1 hypothetical protein C9374_009829 [Naegleria lovaniensis]